MAPSAQLKSGWHPFCGEGRRGRSRQLQGRDTVQWETPTKGQTPVDTFKRAGFAIVESAVDPELLDTLRAEADRLLETSPDRGGCRNGLQKSAILRDLAVSTQLMRYPTALLGPATRPVKLTLFDKTPRANWGVPWHQDLTIAVRERREVAGFGPWSIKEGLPHVQAPVEVLEDMVALRLHLDDTSADNGALKVLPGSHRSGRLSDEESERMLGECQEVVCVVPAGGAMLMSPLLIHASSASASPSRRRVLHFEYSASELPGGLSWPKEAAPLARPIESPQALCQECVFHR